jgi:hypothetical protein
MGHHLATHCWLKSFWEVIDRFRLQLVVDYPEIPFPRLNDQLIIQLAIRLGFSGDDLDRINRCWLACCCIFLSDLASANGRILDPTRGLQGVDYSQSTTYAFPREHPSNEDWAVWHRFWAQYCMSDRTLPVALGIWVHKSHRCWEWYYNSEEDLIVQKTPLESWLYHPCIETESTCSTRSNNLYACTGVYSRHDLDGFSPTSVRIGDTCVQQLSPGHPLS